MYSAMSNTMLEWHSISIPYYYYYYYHNCVNILVYQMQTAEDVDIGFCKGYVTFKMEEKSQRLLCLVTNIIFRPIKMICHGTGTFFYFGWGVIGFTVCELIRKSNTGQNMGQHATMLTSQMFSPWCDCHCIGSALLTF